LGTLLDEIETTIEKLNSSYQELLDTPEDKLTIKAESALEKEIASKAEVIFSTLNYCRKLEYLLDWQVKKIIGIF
jgi:hypothetical protein